MDNDLKHEYYTKGLLVELPGIEHNGLLPNSNHQMSLFRKGRQAQVKSLIYVTGETINPDDLPASIPSCEKNNLLSGFDQQDRHVIAHLALSHEITPGQIYWQEAASELLPYMRRNLVQTYAKSRAAQDALGPRVEITSQLISKRARDLDPLRGDMAAVRMMESLVFGTDVQYPKSLHLNLISHLVAQTRIQNRARRQFAEIAVNLPPEASGAAQVVRSSGMQAEIMDQVVEMRNMHDRDLISATQERQTDVLWACRENISSDLPYLSKAERVVMRNRINAIQKAIKKTKGSDDISSSAETNRHIFRLNPIAAGTDILLIPPEVVRLEREMERSASRPTRLGKEQAAR